MLWGDEDEEFIDDVPDGTPDRFLNIGYGNPLRGKHPYAGVTPPAAKKPRTAKEEVGKRVGGREM